MKIIFFGSSGYVIPIVEILKNNFGLSLVITTDKSEGAVPAYCQGNKIPFVFTSSLKDNDLKSLILNLKSPVAVLADFGLIIPEEILNAFPKGIINLHPSLLPKYRGPTPVQTAILKGEKTTGISIIKLDKEVDHGPVLCQEKEEILSSDTAETLYKKLFEKGASLLPNVLNKYLKDDLELVAQEHEKATFTKPLTRQDGFIGLSPSLENKSLKLKILAYYPWPGVWFRAPLRQGSEGQAKLKIIKLLPGQRLQVEGKKPMTYKDFLNGYPEAKGILEKIN